MHERCFAQYPSHLLLVKHLLNVFEFDFETQPPLFQLSVVCGKLKCCNVNQSY